MTAINPYRISVADDVLSDLKSRLRHTRWPEAAPTDMGYNRGRYPVKVVLDRAVDSPEIAARADSGAPLTDADGALDATQCARTPLTVETSVAPVVVIELASEEGRVLVGN